MKKKEYETEVSGKKLNAIFSDLADQATGSVIVKYGNTTVLATAVMSKKEKDGDYMPLTVDYEERFYAGGKILGSRFVRREGRPSEEAILSGRIVDRTIRPLFDGHIRNEIQVVVTVLALGEEDVNVASVLATSLAIATSEIPWKGPVSAIRIGKVGDSNEFVVNPTNTDKSAGLSFDLFACGADGLINMIEIGSHEASEDALMKGLEKALLEIKKLETFQQKIIKEIGKEKKIIPRPEMPKGVIELFEKEIKPKLHDAVFSGPGKVGIESLKEEWFTLIAEKLPDIKTSFAESIFEESVNDLIHKEAIENNKRPDGRGFDDVRPLYVQAGNISEVLHGSGIFYRGGTHILSVATLGGPQDAQLIAGMNGEETRRYMHHYNFPPFSTGETGRIGNTNRRMIGHGALAEKALVPILPSKEKFPYTVRVVSEAFASNGSTSMGSVCGSSIALMDAGVPIKAPVAGIASGLMIDAKTGKYKVLTDIQGPEDHHGDMDFKVAGTRKGVTAVQMDVKVDGIPLEILGEAFVKAKNAREKILDVMEKEIAVPRPKISPYAPEIITLKIKPDQIGLVIGSGGKTINEIKKITGAEIDIEDDGTVFITGKNDSAEKTRAIIEDMTREYKIGDRFEGEVTRLMDFGAFVRIGRSAEGLVHVSEIAPFRIERVSDFIKVGDIVPVVVKEVDEKGRINLSIKKANPEFIKQKQGSSGK